MITGSHQERTGAFHTPPHVADLLHIVIARALGKNWMNEYTIWDPCAGRGALTAALNIPPEKLFLSTLEEADLPQLHEQAATVFQFDFLNDSIVDIPQELRNILKNKEPLLYLVNPPYVECGRGINQGEYNKRGATQSAIRDQMHAAGIGSAAREMSHQFYYRMHQLAPHAHRACIDKAKHLVSPTGKKVREVMWPYELIQGAAISGKHFADISPMIFLTLTCWKPSAAFNMDVPLDICEWQDVD